MLFMHVRNTLSYRFLSVRLKPANLNQSVAKVEQTFHKLLPEAPFEFTFMDETLQKLYQSEIQLQQAAQLATVLAFVIVLLGVIGMVSLSVARRTKEVGIRKVLGASMRSIIQLFMNEFVYTVVLAFVVAFPLAYILMHRWLQSYAYRIDIGWMSFVGLGIAFILFISVIICLQTLRLARANPVDSLRDE
jgi:putative ABC transport system permease protein